MVIVATPSRVSDHSFLHSQRVFATTHTASEQAHDLTAKLVDQLHVLQNQGKDLPPIIRDVRVFFFAFTGSAILRSSE